MAVLEHGVYTTESPTSLLPILETATAIPLIFGCAPVNLVDKPIVNEVVMAMSYSEAVQQLGFEAAQPTDSGKSKYRYNLSEYIYSNFNFYGVAPIFMVNVLDPEKHKTTASTTSVTIDAESGEGVISELGILRGSVKISHEEAEYTEGEDYTLTFDDDGCLHVVSLTDDDGTALRLPSGVELTFSADRVDPSLVTTADIIGGIEAATGKRKGLELVSEVYSKFGMIPNLLLAPGYSHDPELVAIMATKAVDINTVFNAVVLVDADTEKTRTYSEVPNWKKQANIFDTNVFICWPMLDMNGTLYHMSTQVAGLIGTTDEDEGLGTPMASPSNKSLECTGTCLADGTEVVLGLEEANYLNGSGIATAHNFSGGFKLWGNRTACYPDNTDPKDNFLCVRRMFLWIRNTLVTNMWQHVDKPGNRNLIDTIVNSSQQWLNSLVAQGALLAGRLEFPADMNPTTNLMNGQYYFHLSITPPTPAEKLEFDLELDTSGYETLYS